MKRDHKNTLKKFNAEYYAKSLRHLKVLIASMLDDSQRSITVYQYCNALCFDKSNTDTDSENEAVNEMPSYLSYENQKIKQYHNKINEYFRITLKNNILQKT